MLQNLPFVLLVFNLKIPPVKSKVFSKKSPSLNLTKNYLNLIKFKFLSSQNNHQKFKVFS